MRRRARACAPPRTPSSTVRGPNLAAAHPGTATRAVPCACTAISTKFPSFSNKDKTLIIQYVVKHEQNIDCGGGYMKLFPSTVDQQKLHGGADEVAAAEPSASSPASHPAALALVLAAAACVPTATCALCSCDRTSTTSCLARTSAGTTRRRTSSSRTTERTTWSRRSPSAPPRSEKRARAGPVASRGRRGRLGLSLTARRPGEGVAGPGLASNGGAVGRSAQLAAAHPWRAGASRTRCPTCTSWW